MEVNIRPRLSHSNSFGNDAEKDTAGCRALDRKYIVIGSEDLDEMTTAELNQYLENIAKLIEANAKDAEAAAQIVRDSKVKA